MQQEVDHVIEQLADIEATAVEIMNATEKEKKQIHDEMLKACDEYDTMLEEQTKLALEELEQELEKQQAMELKKLEEETKQTLDALQQKYDSNHRVWVQTIVNDMVRV